MVSNASLIYAKPPHGAPVPGETIKRVVDDNFDPETVALNGGILVQAKALSMDPYMRGRMRDPKVKSYNQPFPLDKPLLTLAVGVVVRSEYDGIKPGQIFKGMFDMSEYAVVPAQLVKIGRTIENKEELPWSTLLGACGMPGATAWCGLYDIGKPKKGETIFVSAASGAVGQIVGQLAKREGLFTIGSAGSDDKVAFLKEIGYDVAFNYKTTSTEEVLEKHQLDIYWDNVGGETLDAALKNFNHFGRIIACGAISEYNVPEAERRGIKNYMNVVTHSLRYQGFIVSNHNQDHFNAEMPQLVKSGEVKIKEHVTKGIDNGESFLDMLEGRNFGKAVIVFE